MKPIQNKDEIIAYRLQGHSTLEISRKFGIAKSTAYGIVKDIELSEEASNLITSKQKEKPKGNECYKNTAAYKANNQFPLVESNYSNRKSFSRGSIAETLVEARLLVLGFDVFRPSIITEACDLLVYNGKNYLRIEVKSTIGKDCSLSRTLYKGGKSQQFRYNQDDKIDFFIVVDLLREQYFIIPFEDIKGRKAIRMSYFGELMKYHNRFDLLNNGTPENNLHRF